jgi:putative transposase
MGSIIFKYLINFYTPNGYNYSRHPQQNAKIERFNRTVQEEFVNRNINLLFQDINQFNNNLLDCLYWRNTERLHYSLHMKTPMEYIINNQECHMYGGYTNSCFL